MTTNAPRILWNGNVLDFPYAVDKFEHEWMPKKKSSQALAGATETLTFRKLDMVRCRLKTHDSLDFYRDCYAWWAWASEGKPFALSFDRADRIDTTVNGALAPEAEIVLNPKFNTWSSDTDADDWAETTGGTGTINRVEDLRQVYSGDDGLSFTSDGAANQFISQSITLATSTKYKLRIRAKNGSLGTKTFARVQNTGTGNYLQNDLTWGASTGNANEPSFTADTGEFSEHTWEFTTEVSGTTFTVRIYQSGDYAAAEVLYVGEFSIIKKQKATLSDTDGILVGGAYRLRMAPANGLKEELVIVDAIDSSTVIELSEPALYTYAATDVFRSVEHFPALYIPREKQPHKELPTLVYVLDIRAVEHVT